MLASSGTEVQKPLVFTNLDDPAVAAAACDPEVPGSFPGVGAKRRRHSSTGSNSISKVPSTGGVGVTKGGTQTTTGGPSRLTSSGSKHGHGSGSHGGSGGGHVANHIPSDPHQTCRVCEGRASGLHFGEYTCESCKLFFLRQTKHEKPAQKIVCPLTWTCDINTKVKSKCRACRFKKCCEVGMSKDRVIYGRNARAKPTMYNLSSAGPIPSPAPLNSPVGGSISPGSGQGQPGTIGTAAMVTTGPNMCNNTVSVESLVNTFVNHRDSPSHSTLNGGSSAADFDKTGGLSPFVHFNQGNPLAPLRHPNGPSLPRLNFFDALNSSPAQGDFAGRTRQNQLGTPAVASYPAQTQSLGSFCEVAAVQAVQKSQQHQQQQVLEIKQEPGTVSNPGCYLTQKPQNGSQGSLSPQSSIHSPNSGSSPQMLQQGGEYSTGAADTSQGLRNSPQNHQSHNTENSWNSLVSYPEQQTLVTPLDQGFHKGNTAHINNGSPLHENNPQLQRNLGGTLSGIGSPLPTPANAAGCECRRQIHTLDAMQTSAETFEALFPTSQFMDTRSRGQNMTSQMTSQSRDQNRQHSMTSQQTSRNHSMTSQLGYQSGNSSGSESDDRSIEFLLNDRFGSDGNSEPQIDSQPPEGTVSELWLELPNLEFVCKYCFKSPCFCFGVCKF